MNNQLIPVFSGNVSDESQLLCNARDLHKFLGVGKRFASWIAERIGEYQFIENQDYIIISQNREKIGRGRPAKDYHLTLDTAKELAMVERNDKGRQVRRYFIECEKRVLQEAIASKPTRTRKRIAPPAINTKRFIECFATIETAWSQIHKDLLIIDPTSAAEVSPFMEIVLRVGRTYQSRKCIGK